MPFVPVQVSSTTDSAHAHYGETNDSMGRAIFILEPGKSYKVRLRAMNYKPVSKVITVKEDQEEFVLIAEPDSKTLNGVGVTAKRPLLRQEDDKTIVDAGELAGSSTSAYDMMEKVPGIFVDQDGNIYITSATPATIYINGREQKMSNSDVAAMLKSLPPHSIDRIEIMRTPSAKYDASSSGGIVNVILKRGVRIGVTGNVNAGMNQGTYGNQFAGATISNNDGKWNTSLTLQASRRESGERLKTDRRVRGDSVLSQDAYTKYPGHTYFGSYSIGYEPGKKWDLTYDGRVSVNSNQSESNSPALIEQKSTGAAFVGYNTAVNNDADNINITQGFSAKYKPDTTGSEWSTDFSYTYVPTTSSQSYNTMYTLPFNSDLKGNGTIHTHNRYLSLRSDITKKLPLKTTLEMGVKMTGVWYDNKTNYTITDSNITTVDTSRTNSYKYDEQIYAAYLQVSKNFGKVLVKAGTRLESTNMDGQQTDPADAGFTLNRTDLFPYVYISRDLFKIMGYDLRGYLIYRRTISRPSYEYLNPFPKYIDQYLSEAGNPSLRPQLTDNYEANISFDEHPILAIGYNDMKDIFSQVVYRADSSHLQTFRTYDNLGTNKELYLRGMGGLPPGMAYFFVIGVQYNHNVYEGQYQGAPLNYEHNSWTAFTYQTLKLGKLTQLTLNGFVRFKGQLQFYELSTFGSLNMSINHQFLNKKLKVTLSVNDIFLTNNNEFTINQGDIHATGLRKGDTRRFGINAMYNFGFRKKEDHGFLNEETPEGK